MTILGWIELRRKNYTEAKRRYEELLAIKRDLDDTEGVAQVLKSLKEIEDKIRPDVIVHVEEQEAHELIKTIDVRDAKPDKQKQIGAFNKIREIARKILSRSQ